MLLSVSFLYLSPVAKVFAEKSIMIEVINISRMLFKTMINIKDQ